MSGWTPGYTIINIGLIIASPILITGYAFYKACEGIAGGVSFLYRKACDSSDEDRRDEVRVSSQSIFKTNSDDRFPNNDNDRCSVNQPTI
jgi:hypothetical protein